MLFQSGTMSHCIVCLFSVVKRTTHRGPSGPSTEIIIVKDDKFHELYPSEGDRNLNNGVTRLNQANGVSSDPEEVGLLESPHSESNGSAKHKVTFVTFQKKKNNGEKDSHSENIDTNEDVKMNNAKNVDTDSLTEHSSQEVCHFEALIDSPETDI